MAMTLILSNIQTKTSAKAGEYTLAKGDIVRKDGSVLKGFTVMAFGKQRASVKGFLKEGRKLVFNAIFEKDRNRSIKILGPGRKPKAKKAA